MISGLLILAVFAVFAGLMYARVMPAILAVPLMAVSMAFVAGVPAQGIATIVVDGSASLAPVYVSVIFGAMLGRVTLDTGIAKAIVNFAAEFGGEKPMALALVLCAVVAVLFVSLSGLGAIIMVGSIVLPIMMTTGVPRKVASTLFLMSFALGFIFNIANWKFYTKLFGVEQQQLYAYALVLAAIDLAALVVYAIVAFRTTRDYATWAVRAERPARASGVPWWSLITPVLPIALYFFLKLDATLAFIISAIYGVLTTRPKQSIPTLVAAAIRGVEDVAPAIMLFIGIGMLLTATKAPQFTAALQPLVAVGALHNPVVYVVLFGLLSPLVLYRGPLNPFGVGIAIFTVLLTAHVFPPLVLVATIMAVVQVQNVCDPTNTANVWVANYTGTPIDEITKRTLPYQVAVATVGCIAIVAASGPLLGVRAFGSVVAPAAAAELFPGLFAPPAAAYRIAVGEDGSSAAKRAAGAVVGAMNGWGNVRAFTSQENPNAADCSAKKYVAYVNATSTTFRITAGTDLDIGIVLSDCGGWEVDQWHDHAVYDRAPTTEEIDALALQGVARMQLWMRAHPAPAQNLLTKGLAYAPSEPPTYYYSLFKTVDGDMRVFVRAGGPAYSAGLRSNDIVDKLDGKFWWEYGTYQTQLRAYDGKPHSFEIERGNKTIDVQLGQAFQG
ncbi:MAG: hypothetical protein ACXVAF_02060 [Vulcanimicrobiaceae bacterium]